jgi:thymidylate synthase
MRAYIDIIRKILERGRLKKNRTGVDALSYSGILFEHDMEEGFPLLTTKRVSFRLVASELEFFIRGLTGKDWLQKNNNHIWDEWCSPDRAAYGAGEEARKLMAAENDLGPIYGWQWRHFGAEYVSPGAAQGRGIDQLKQVVDTLKKNSHDRRMIVSAWNPLDIGRMALPPCHYAFQLTADGDRLNLLWNQRSVDTALGLPFNIASYAALLHLFALEAQMKEGRLVGFLGDTHIYVNHLETLEKQIVREVRELPRLKTERFTSIFDWTYSDSTVENYNPHPKLDFEIAV